MKYIAKVLGQEHTVAVESDDQITVDGSPCAAHLEAIDGEALFSLLIGNASHEVFVERHGNRYYVVVEGKRYEVQVEDAALWRIGQPGTAARQEVGEAAVTSPMPGIVVTVLAQEGQLVQAGDGVVILEAMKMENEIREPCGGIVKSVRVAAGQTVNQNEVMLTIGASED